MNEKRDVKIAMMAICDYCLLEGRNTDWAKVCESIGKIESEFDAENGFNALMSSDFHFMGICKKIEGLLESVDRGLTFGEDERTIVYKLLCIADIYRDLQKWDTIR